MRSAARTWHRVLRSSWAVKCSWRTDNICSVSWLSLTANFPTIARSVRRRNGWFHPDPRALIWNPTASKVRPVENNCNIDALRFTATCWRVCGRLIRFIKSTSGWIPTASMAPSSASRKTAASTAETNWRFHSVDILLLLSSGTLLSFILGDSERGWLHRGQRTRQSNWPCWNPSKISTGGRMNSFLPDWARNRRQRWPLCSLTTAENRRCIAWMCTSWTDRRRWT